MDEELCKCCRTFYDNGWMRGTGGGASVADVDRAIIYMTPSGVEKELVRPGDLAVYHEWTYVNGGRPSSSAPLFIMLHA